MTKITQILFLISIFFVTFVSANENIQYNEKGQIILETINKLEKDGYITEKNALEAKKEMVFDDDSLIQLKLESEQKKDDNRKATNNNDISIFEYLSFINFLKFSGIILILIGTRGILFKVFKVFTKVPPILYQVLFLSSSLYLTFEAETVLPQQAFYLSVFCVLFNIIIAASICYTYQKQVTSLLKVLSLNIPPQIVASFYSTLYFGFFTIYLESSFLGIFSIVSFVSMFGFTMGSTGVCTWIGYEKDDYIDSSLFINGLIVILYSLSVAFDYNLQYVDYFSVGIEYVCAIVLVVTLMIRSSWISDKEGSVGFYILLFIVLEALSLTGLYLYNLEVIPVIMNTAFFIFLLSWLGYLSAQAGGIVLAFVMGISLWAISLLLESHPEIFVNSLI